MRKLIFLIVACTVFFTGCKDGSILPKRNEIQRLEMLRVIGLDKSEDSGLLKVTVTSKREEGGGGNSGGNGEEKPKQKAIVLTSEGKTMFSAERKFQTYTDKEIFFGHVDYYLFGEDAAKEDFTKYIDFFTRDHEMRLDSLVFIVRGEATQLIKKSSTSDYFIADRLEAISKNAGLLSLSGEMRMLKIMGELDQNDIFAFAIPSIKLIQRKEDISGIERQPKEDLEIDGYGIIKDFKLIGFLNRAIARGYNFIQNKIAAGTIDLIDKTGNSVAMEIMGNSTKIIPRVENAKVTGITIKSVFETNIDEVHSREDIFTEDILHYLEQQQSEQIIKDMEKCVEYAKENKADFLGIGKAVNLRHPIIWERIKDQWPAIFKDIPIMIKVESKINRTYDIQEPNGYRAGGKR